MRLKHATKYAGRAGAVAVPATALVATALVTTSMMTTAGASPSTARTSGLSSAFGVSATVGVVLAVIGMLYFRRVERTFADLI